MQTLQSFDAVLASSKPVSLTIGTFDGVHLGHQAVLNRLQTIARENNGESAVVTFKNHPADILRPEKKIKSLCTLTHKLRLIEELGIDYMLLMSFNENLANMTAEEFIKHVRSYYPFSHLILGHDASFGKNRQGNHATVKNIADRLGFSVEYLPQTKVDETTVSSSRIRNFLEHGDFHNVNKYLGRKYSLYSRVISGSQDGRAIGFPTANLSIEGLCLPPDGVYGVYVLHEGQRLPGVANIGIAPTLKKTESLHLEVHLLNYQNVLYDIDIEVEFVGQIRKEKKFRTIADLQHQIAKDIRFARKHFFKEDF